MGCAIMFSIHIHFFLVPKRSLESRFKAAVLRHYLSLFLEIKY